MPARTLTSVEDVLSVLATGYGVPAGPDHPGLDVLTRSLIAASRAPKVRPGDAEFQLAALLVDIGRLLPLPTRGRSSLDAAVDEIRELLGRRIAELVALQPDAVAYRTLLASTPDDDPIDLSSRPDLISPARLRRLRRHRSFADSMVLASLVEKADTLDPAPALLTFHPLLEAVATATARERELSLQSLQLLAIPR